MFNFILFILSVLNNLIKGELTVDGLIMVLQELSILYILCCKSYLHIQSPFIYFNSQLSFPCSVHRKELEKRPASSAYIKPNDLTTIPAPIPQKLTAVPFEDVYKFVSQNVEDGLYIDLVSLVLSFMINVTSVCYSTSLYMACKYSI